MVDEVQEGQDLPHEGHSDPSIAYHIKWPYSDRAFLWNDKATKRRKTDPCGVNFMPLATELRSWLLREGGQVSYFSHDREGRGPLTITNPYTESGSVLTLMYADAVNEAHAFANATDEMDDISEACIKQLLFCTAIATKDYKKSALGGLLVRECRACQKAGQPHNISLLGSLAHRFGLCLQIEGCLDKHLAIANRRRNTQASHATFSGFEPKPVKEVRTRLSSEVTKLGEELVHMLQHIGQIEDKMREELEYALSVGMQDPWWQPM